MRLGIFGGTFDPPHVGHLILAMEAYDQLDLDKVLWVIAPNPPHKLGKVSTPIAQRIEMVRSAIDSDPMFALSRVDIDRPGPHYVLDTMRLLHVRYPSDDLIFIMGGDSLHDLPNWHEPKEFLKECSGVGVMHRPGEKFDLSSLSEELPGIEKKVEFIEAPLLEISSNKIRALAFQKKPFRYYLPAAVYDHIRSLGLYTTKESI
ncbi:MAG TPA: nicotinate (nicotinamide) nucleotide adenylyltransferase [Anaerolineaceae bacterium]|uniref:Probable nicotinate-nucleotide adenylyltransferase n=1 Tax=Anaerolinea thermophila TaxID=167964 RepID=A0A101FZ12_9CHLR|nr:MAG: putative nicotinate-nucleotide adenylyltransferase [Anaerolinea thermophila]HAF62758.1 nicotinate (nicotinamide) nucleotide adenylyltransferase [Anaerolineaceae bacterium]